MIHLRKVFGLAPDAFPSVYRKLSPQERRGFRTAHHAVTQKTIVAHAEADISSFQISFDWVRLSSRSCRLHVVPGLWLPAILASVGAALIGSMLTIESHHVHSSWAESRRIPGCAARRIGRQERDGGGARSVACSRRTAVRLALAMGRRSDNSHDS